MSDKGEASARPTESPGVDLFKVVMAVLVISIHTSPLLSYGRAVNGFLVQVAARMAVPYFFVAAGYFFISKCVRAAEAREGALKTTLRYLRHLLMLYAVWSFVYVGMYFAINRALPSSLNSIGSWVWPGIYGLLWFFLVLMAGSLFWSLFYRFCSGRFALPVTTVLYILSYLPGLNGGVSIYLRGTAVIGAGGLIANCIAQKRGDLSRLRDAFLLGVAAASIIVESLIWYVDERNGMSIPHGIFMIFGSMAIFVYSMHRDFGIGCRTGGVMRKLSTYLYVTHGIVLLFPIGAINNCLLRFLVVLGASAFWGAVLIAAKSLGHYSRSIDEKRRSA